MSITTTQQMAAGMPLIRQEGFGWTTADTCYSVPYKGRHPGKALSTSGHFGRRGSPWADQEDRPMLTYASYLPERDPIAQAGLSRLRHLAEHEAGWDGTDIAAPDPNAIKDAMALVVDLVHAGVKLKPRIGLDSDGAISFLFVAKGEPVADFTIPGNGTYSFFAQRNESVASKDAARISWPIPQSLLDILAD